ncbi:MAG: SRPBCC family protein, partial [Bacteroidia bacterium]|nr:SRPBCC family protein [Bacteroidia bacterium]
MSSDQKTSIRVSALIEAPVQAVWNFWTHPFHILKWNQASDDWFTPYAENDLREGGKFLSRMEARDGSMGFDFEGTYEKVVPHTEIVYSLADDRRIQVLFEEEGPSTRVTEIFDAENENPVEMQEAGWQAILNNFKKYVEGRGGMQVLRFEKQIAASAAKVYQTLLSEPSYRE